MIGYNLRNRFDDLLFEFTVGFTNVGTIAVIIKAVVGAYNHELYMQLTTFGIGFILYVVLLPFLAFPLYILIRKLCGKSRMKLVLTSFAFFIVSVVLHFIIIGV